MKALSSFGMKLDPHCFANSIGEAEDENNCREPLCEENNNEDMENESDVWMPIYATARCGHPANTKKSKTKKTKKPSKKGEPFLALHTYT